jgi:hypothetical protein
MSIARHNSTSTTLLISSLTFTKAMIAQDDLLVVSILSATTDREQFLTLGHRQQSLQSLAFLCVNCQMVAVDTLVKKAPRNRNKEKNVCDDDPRNVAIVNNLSTKTES